MMLKADLHTQEEFTFEVKRWKSRSEVYSTDQVKQNHLCETFELVTKICIRIFNVL